MEYLSPQDKATHSIDEVFDDILAPLLSRQIIVAQVEELDGLPTFDNIQNLHGLLREELCPGEAQALDLLVRLQEHAGVIEELCIVERHLFKVQA